MATHKISEIKGLSTELEAKMGEAQIATIEQLLEQTKDSKSRSALAKTLGIESKELTEYINRADLMRLKGVGGEMANLLEECGVELVQRAAAPRRREPTGQAEEHQRYGQDHAPRPDAGAGRGLDCRGGYDRRCQRSVELGSTLGLHWNRGR